MSQPYKVKELSTGAHEDLLTVSEAASVFGVTPTTIRNWDKNGKLLSHRHPKNDYRLYSFSDLTKIVPANQRPLFVQEKEIEVTPSQDVLSYKTLKEFRTLVRQMSKAFRDSQGGNLMDRFEEISKILFAKMHDERAGGATFILRGHENDDDIYQRVSTAYQNAVKSLPESFRDYGVNLSTDRRAVIQIAKLLSGFSLLKVPGDVKGTAFEELIRNTFDKTENQQFFTPRTVVNFIIRFIDINGAKKVLDPACGTGGFLIEAASLANDAGATLIGAEVDKRMAWISQMNLQIHGYGKHEIHCFPNGGSLSHGKEVQEKIPYSDIEIIVTNPPFGSDFTDIKELKNYKLAFDKKSRRRGVLFIERCISWLKPGGKLGIIIDDGVLNSSSNYDVRKFMLDNCVLEAVISLPISAFLPYASVKSSILFLRKKGLDLKQEPVFMAEAESVGRKPNGDPYFGEEYDEAGNPILINDLPEILAEWIAYKKTRKLTGTKENIFLCSPEILFDEKENENLRIDSQFHHPSKQVAREVLHNSNVSLEKLSNLVGVRNVSVVPNVQDPEDIWTYVGLANITSATGEFGPTQVMGNQIKSAVKLYRARDILFSKLRPELRKVVLVPEEATDGFASSECYVLTPGDKIDKDYLAFLLRSDIVYGQLIYQTSGVGRPRINIGALLGVKVPLPSLEKQKQIVKHLKNVEASRRSLERKMKEDQLKIKQLLTEANLILRKELLG